MGLPEKTYDRLHSLWKRWELPQEDVYYAVNLTNSPAACSAKVKPMRSKFGRCVKNY
jgi:hypothetical protein